MYVVEISIERKNADLLWIYGTGMIIVQVRWQVVEASTHCLGVVLSWREVKTKYVIK